MVIQLTEKANSLDTNNPIDNSTDEQRLTLPGFYSWQQFLDLEVWLGDRRGLRIVYLDGNIELMTLGETHESTKGILRFLLEVYFVEKNLRFFPVGSATRQDQAKEVSFEPDESYYLGEKKSCPDLAIEIIITSGNLNKLEKYRRIAIPEVWFWQNNQLFLYHWQGADYVQSSRSQLFPDLDIALFLRCLQIPDPLEARLELLKGLVVVQCDVISNRRLTV